MFLRFIIDQRDEDSERNAGVFHAAAELRERGELEDFEADALAEVRDWFNQHLEKPLSFSRTKQYSVSPKKRGISWFRSSAQEHITKAHSIAAILARHGVHVRVLKAERIGYVVYEDEYQVVAEPFSDLVC